MLTAKADLSPRWAHMLFCWFSRDVAHTLIILIVAYIVFCGALSRFVCHIFSFMLWRKLGSLATHWAHSEDSDAQADWVFAGRTLILLVLSCHGPFSYFSHLPVYSFFKDVFFIVSKQMRVFCIDCMKVNHVILKFSRGGYIKQTRINWAGPWENVSYVICEQQRRRSAFIVHCFDSTISVDFIAEISRL